jgi:hypothetical protein
MVCPPAPSQPTIATQLLGKTAAGEPYTILIMGSLFYSHCDKILMQVPHVFDENYKRFLCHWGAMNLANFYDQAMPCTKMSCLDWRHCTL